MEALLSSVVRLSKELDINKVILFGSRARGDNTEKSDYDIAFIVNALKNRTKFSG